MGTHVNPWLICVNVWQKPLQSCKVISLQLIKINEKKERNMDPSVHCILFTIARTWMQTICPLTDE